MDPFHTTWSLVKGCVKGVGLWEVLRDWTVECNALHGPWGHGGFWQTVTAAGHHYCSIATTSCPLLPALTFLVRDALCDVVPERREFQHLEMILDKVRGAAVFKATMSN